LTLREVLFFSSRRRHTISKRDWSSDVCSSDLPFIALLVLGIFDISQTRHAIRRNYPVLGNLRFFFGFIRPEIRQYFIESDTQPLPFSRVDRSLVYRRAKQENDKLPFGTQLDLYTPRYEWINHSMSPSVIK